MYKIARIPEDRYCSYFDYALQLRGEGASLCGECMYTPAGQIAKDVTVTFHKQDCVLTYADFGIVATEYQRAWNGRAGESSVGGDSDDCFPERYPNKHRCGKIRVYCRHFRGTAIWARRQRIGCLP